MITNLKPYPAMKDSGVPWLGEVPEHWEVRRLKRVCRLAYGDALASGARRDGKVPVYGSNGIVGFHSVSNTRSPCIVVGRKGSFGKIKFSAQPVFAIDTAYYIDSNSSSADLRWLYYLLGWLQLDVTSQDAAIPGLNREEVYQKLAPVPSLLEQATIVRFLDHADRRIRRYIRAKRKLIKLLEEQKRAIIHRAVTRGLDPNVRLKPSGADWLGDMPEHWEATPLSQVLQQRKEKNKPIKTTDILSLSLNTGVIPYSEKKGGGNKAKEDLSAYMLAHPGDIVLNSMNVVVGSVGLSKYFGAVSPVYYMLRPWTDEDKVEYFNAVFQDSVFHRSLFGLGNGIMYIESKSTGKLNTVRLRIPMNKLKRVIVPRPPTSEQEQIVEHLEEVEKEHGSTVSRLTNEVSLLEEYRTRLIADVVTGKLDVREAAAQLTEEAEETEGLSEEDDFADDEGEEIDDPEELLEEVES